MQCVALRATKKKRVALRATRAGARLATPNDNCLCFLFGCYLKPQALLLSLYGNSLYCSIVFISIWGNLLNIFNL